MGGGRRCPGRESAGGGREQLFLARPPGKGERVEGRQGRKRRIFSGASVLSGEGSLCASKEGWMSTKKGDEGILEENGVMCDCF
ncbi:hypothetical protein CDAR_375781 [Caerostris darwini]|uniref:Uncharacterized protein n=1 Tax=Caerostris darwini TaxID=1538125 RepID=A0AAV4S819_9ARAC|nr:hypothetical protein CDAR_375781 [Caerostris darwini]